MRFSSLWLALPASLALALAACNGNVYVDSSAGNPSGGAGASSGAGGRPEDTGNTGGHTTVTTVTTGTAGAGGEDFCADVQSDPENCGACGHSCLGGECVAGACQPVAIACGQSPKALAVDATHVYWLNDYDIPGVLKAPKNGGDVTILAADPNSASGWGIALDETHVYWPGNPGVQSVPKEGGTAKLLSSTNEAYDVAADGSSVYFTRPGLTKVNKTGGAPTSLAGSSDTIHVVLDGEFAYFTVWTEGAVVKVPLSGGAPMKIATNVQYPNALALRDGIVYFSNGYGKLMKVPADGSAAPVLITGAYFAYGVAADESGVYFATFDSEKIAMVVPGTEEIKILATDQAYPRDVAVDAEAVYWTNDLSVGNNEGCIMKVAKPLP